MRTATLPCWLLLAGGLQLVPTTAIQALPTPVARKTVAVLSFDNNSGDAQYDPLGKGLAAMMISDLSSVESIQLVERERLQELIEEQNLQHSRRFDSATAVEVGRFAGAEYVVTGAVMALQPRVRIDTRVIRVETAEIVKTAQVTGREDRLFELQERLARELIDGLEIALSPEEYERLRQQQEANRVEDLRIALTYSQALDHFDRGAYVDAAEKMYIVVRAAPNSALMRLTYEQMRDRAARGARRRFQDRVGDAIRRRIP
jgi:TolB-like protein